MGENRSAASSRLNALRIAIGCSNLSEEEREYSPVGLIHKQKYARLRTRQKKRLSSKRTSLRFRESHTEVLNRFIRAENWEQVWSDEELDCLWLGVRRYGLTNWESMLRDPRLRFSELKTAADLEAKWTLEELKA